MKRQTWLCVVSCVLMGLASGVLARAEGLGDEGRPAGPGLGRDRNDEGSGGPGGPGGPEGPALRETMIIRFIQNPRVAKALELTEEQRETLQRGGKALAKEREELQTQLLEAGREQARLFRQETVDEGALMAAVEKTGRVRTEIAKLEARGLILVIQALTPEQRQQARQMMHQRMERARREGGVPPKGPGRRFGKEHPPEGPPPE